jgi:hypothetical protein
MRRSDQPTLRLALAVGVLLVSSAAAGSLLAGPAAGLPVGVVAERGDSMGTPGPELVVYGPTDGAVGDVVLFQSEAGWLRHRVVARTPEGRLTQGDAEPHVDQRGPNAIAPVTDAQLLGEQWVAVRLSTLAWAAVGLLVGASVVVGSRYATLARDSHHGGH